MGKGMDELSLLHGLRIVSHRRRERGGRCGIRSKLVSSAVCGGQLRQLSVVLLLARELVALRTVDGGRSHGCDY